MVSGKHLDDVRCRAADWLSHRRAIRLGEGCRQSVTKTIRRSMP